MTDSVTTTTPYKRFSGMVGLRPAFGDKEGIAGRGDVTKIWKKWSMHRHSQNKPYVGIMVGYAEDSLSSLESESELVFTDEPVVSVRGELHTAHAHLNDEEIIETLKSLFCHIAKALKQTRVSFVYYGKENYMCSYNIMYPEKRKKPYRRFGDEW